MEYGEHNVVDIVQVEVPQGKVSWRLHMVVVVVAQVDTDELQMDSTKKEDDGTP
jgi:hypothetical protein